MEDINEDINWLSNDIICFINDDVALFSHLTPTFYNIFSRHPNLKNNQDIPNYFFQKFEKNSVHNQIRIILGLMTPDERQLLSTKLHSQFTKFLEA